MGKPKPILKSKKGKKGNHGDGRWEGTDRRRLVEKKNTGKLTTGKEKESRGNR